MAKKEPKKIIEKKSKKTAVIHRLWGIFEEIDENKKVVAKKLIENAIFMEEELEKLQEIIRKKGYSEVYQNGANQSGTKPVAEVNVYNTMIKNYSGIIKQLDAMLPAGENNDALDFINNALK